NGVNGFIVVDLPPEESKHLRGLCTQNGLRYFPYDFIYVYWEKANSTSAVLTIDSHDF
ncbi:7066_t:CDS:2, partial [Ambispora leptoticha]